jgi:probable F420-dependent oxidoreductase
MDFGVVLQNDPPAARVIELARQAELYNFSHVWSFDSHLLWQEPYVVLSQILAATRRTMVGPMVTNPATRDWTVIASMFATLNEMFGNRTICGIGRGDSAVRTINNKPVTLERLRAAIEVIRPLANGEVADYKGSQLRLPWVTRSRLPIWVAAYGPKALALTGEVADGLILQLADPDITSWSISAVRHAAQSAGRDPDSITICVAAPAYVTDGSADQRAWARNQCRWFGRKVATHATEIVGRYGADGTVVPRALTDFVAERQDFGDKSHSEVGNAYTNFVPDEVIERFCLIGPPTEQVARLTQLAELGVDQFALYLQQDAKEATLAVYGEQIIPLVNTRTTKR